MGSSHEPLRAHRGAIVTTPGARACCCAGQIDQSARRRLIMAKHPQIHTRTGSLVYKRWSVQIAHDGQSDPRGNRVTKEGVVNGLLSAIQMGREQQNPAAMISGFVQIAKLCGFYEPEKVNLTLSAGGKRLSAKFAAMSDDELLAIIAGS